MFFPFIKIWRTADMGDLKWPLCFNFLGTNFVSTPGWLYIIIYQLCCLLFWKSRGGDSYSSNIKYLLDCPMDSLNIMSAITILWKFEKYRKIITPTTTRGIFMSSFQVVFIYTFLIFFFRMTSMEYIQFNIFYFVAKGFFPCCYIDSFQGLFGYQK